MSIDTEVAAGAELGPFSLKTLVGLAASVDSMATELKRLRQIEEAYQFGPLEVPVRASATADAAGDTIVLDLGGPSFERKWQVRRISVGGLQWTTTAAGKALIVVQSSKNATPATADVADYAASLPLPAFYSTGQLIVRNPNRLYVVILGPTANQAYVAGGSVEDLPDKRVPVIAAD
ncbi:MAG: hypothetical protein KGI89_15740 [Euryarchaeota archaeon]|nr:hypothetical protein [Euryarchaeota archaeon]